MSAAATYEIIPVEIGAQKERQNGVVITFLISILIRVTSAVLCGKRFDSMVA